FSMSLRSLLQLLTPADPRRLLPVHLSLLTPLRDCPSDRRPVASPRCASPIPHLSSFRHAGPALDRHESTKTYRCPMFRQLPGTWSVAVESATRLLVLRGRRTAGIRRSQKVAVRGRDS